MCHFGDPGYFCHYSPGAARNLMKKNQKFTAFVLGVVVCVLANPGAFADDCGSRQSKNDNDIDGRYIPDTTDVKQARSQASPADAHLEPIAVVAAGTNGGSSHEVGDQAGGAGAELASSATGTPTVRV